MDDITKNVFSRLGSEWIDYKFTPEDYVAADDKVVAYGTYTGTYRQSLYSEGCTCLETEG